METPSTPQTPLSQTPQPSPPEVPSEGVPSQLPQTPDRSGGEENASTHLWKKPMFWISVGVAVFVLLVGILWVMFPPTWFAPRPVEDVPVEDVPGSLDAGLTVYVNPERVTETSQVLTLGPGPLGVQRFEISEIPDTVVVSPVSGDVPASVSVSAPPGTQEQFFINFFTADGKLANGILVFVDVPGGESALTAPSGVQPPRADPDNPSLDNAIAATGEYIVGQTPVPLVMGRFGAIGGAGGRLEAQGTPQWIDFEETEGIIYFNGGLDDLSTHTEEAQFTVRVYDEDNRLTEQWTVYAALDVKSP